MSFYGNNACTYIAHAQSTYEGRKYPKKLTSCEIYTNKSVGGLGVNSPIKYSSILCNRRKYRVHLQQCMVQSSKCT
jgi:hypothetical protein